MPGLEKIIEEILAEARERAADILSEAQSEGASIRETAEKESREELEVFQKKTEQEQKAAGERARSSAQLKKKQALLAAKQQMITQTIEQAHERILQLDTKAYFQMLMRLLEKNLLSKEGILCLNSRDLKRMPKEFAVNAAALAGQKGGKLTVSEKPADIDGGFLLVYGGMEENCSFEALFRSEREQLVDLVYPFTLG